MTGTAAPRFRLGAGGLANWERSEFENDVRKSVGLTWKVLGSRATPFQPPIDDRLIMD